MNFTSGKLFVAAGVTLMLVGLLALSFAAPATTIGQETDVPVEDVDDGGADVGAGAEGPDEEAAAPPASLPSTGSGGSGSGTGIAKAVVITLLLALGLSLAGAGAITARRSHDTIGS